MIFLVEVLPAENENNFDYLYSLKKMNELSDLESGIKEDFDLFMEGKFINDRMFSNEKLGGMIYNELYKHFV